MKANSCIQGSDRSVPATPALLMCSVHWEPSKYRCWWRPEGSGCQPAGAADATAAGGAGAAAGAGGWGAAAGANPAAGASGAEPIGTTSVMLIGPLRKTSHGAFQRTRV